MNLSSIKHFVVIKYNKMSNFPIQKQTYDPIAVDSSIKQFESELEDEVVLSKTLNDTNSDDKIVEATQFLSKYGPKINEQHSKLEQLSQDIRTIVIQNKEMQQEDIEFDNLMKSAEYIDLASKMSSIKHIISSLDSFLVEQGVKGQIVPDSDL